MKIIVGGAGNVGRSIISYLSRANHDIIVLDTDQSRLDEISKEFDIQPVLGSVSRPDILEKVGADTADILIAATNNDEVNLVACQVAYTLFHIKKKIARIDSEYFLSPLWNTLYNEKSLPVDLVISPDQEIANHILSILSIANAKEVYSFSNNHFVLFSFQCTNDTTIYQLSISELYKNFTDVPFNVVQIIRDGINFFPKEAEHISKGDDVYILAEKENVSQILRIFNIPPRSNDSIVIFGGNAISYDIARHLEDDENISSLKIITSHLNAAQRLSEALNKTVVIHGEMMSDVILNDANLSQTDMTISVTEQDKDNLLLSLLSQHNGVTSTISLVNSRIYDNLTDHIGSNIIVDRSTVTISKILRDIREVNLISAYSLGRGFAEVWEFKLKKDTILEGKTVESLNLPEKCKVIGIERNKQLIIANDKTTLQLDDILIVLVHPNGIKKTENIFKN